MLQTDSKNVFNNWAIMIYPIIRRFFILFYAQCISNLIHFPSDWYIRFSVFNWQNSILVSLQCLSDVKYHVTPFWKRMSFLWITCLFRDGFNLQINKASWIFLLKPLADDEERICQWNLSPMFSFRYLDGAESCFGSSCWSHRFSAICFVSPTYDSSGLLMLVPLYMTLALRFIWSFNLNSVLMQKIRCYQS